MTMWGALALFGAALWLAWHINEQHEGDPWCPWEDNKDGFS